MRDDVPVPPEHDDAGHEALEQDLRALFTPAAAPREFRQRLKSELLHDRRARIALPPDTRTGSRLAWLGAHRRAAILVSSAVAIAAALLLTAAVRGFSFVPVSTLPPQAPTSTPTHAPALVIAPAPTATIPPSATAVPTTPPSPTARPTYTPTPRAHHRHRGGTGLTARHTAVARPRWHHSHTATVTPAPTATTAAPTATVAGVVAPAAVATTPAASATAQPTSTPTATPSVTASAIATAPPLRLATATPRPRTHSAQPTATPTAKALTLPPLAHTPAPTPTATPRPATTPPVTLPALGVTIPLPPRATATPPPVTPPSATPRPTATPSASATPRPTATARPTPSATPQPSATPSATASPTNTPPPIVINPLDQPYGLPVPNAGNGILSSPLNGALPYAQQPVSYTVATTLTLAAPQELSVYPLTTTDVTVVDALTIARQVGATGILSGPTVQPDGSLLATVQIGALRYTLDVFGGYGAPWFTLHAVQSSTGYASPARVAAWADAWLHAHGLASPDLRLLDASGDTASYGQNVGGLPLLGSVAVQLRFDGRGVLHDLSDAYVRPASAIPSALQAPAIAAAAAVDQGQGLYQGPSASTVSGPAAIGAVTLAYVGVRGIHNYIEPIYVLSGTAPTASGVEPFNLYAPALQYTQDTPTATATPRRVVNG